LPCEHAEDEEAPHEDEVLVFSPPFDEIIKVTIPPAQEKENAVSHLPFQDFDDAIFHDSESEGVLKKSLDALDPSSYNKDDDVIDNIDEFIHVGKRKWDVIGHDGHSIYDIEGHSQLLPLQQPYVIAIDSDVW
jgi:hypothetical protein